MTETMNFGPEWMKNSSGANQSGASTQKTPTTPTTPNSVGFRKFALAEFRYGKEDMLTLYAADNLKLSNDVVQSVSLITSEVVTPMAFLPFTEEEQILFAGCVNSNNSLRLAGRGSGPPTRGGRGGRGRGRGRGGTDGNYYHRSYSYEEHSGGGGGSGDHFNWQTDSNRGGYEYGRGRGAGGSGGNRSGWSNNNWRDSANSSEESDRWSSGTNNRWPPPNPGNHHPGRPDSGWRSRDESKKDSLLPEWAQQDGSHNTENKSTPKENSSEQVKEKLPDKTVVANEVLTDKHPVTRTEVKSVESHPVSTTIPKDANTAPPVVNSNVGAQEVPVNKAEDIEPARTFTEQRVTPLEPVVNSVKHSAPKKETESRIKNSLSQLTEEPISPDGFTHFEKAAEDLLLTEEEETPSSSPTVFSSSNPSGDTISTAYPSTASSALTFTNNHIKSSHPLNNAIPSVASTILQQNTSKTVSLSTPDRGVVSLEEFFTWYYQDPDGMTQGPFTSGEMKEWFDAGYFTMDLMVRRACDSHMLPLGQVIQMWKRIPFVTEGKQPPPVNVTEPFWQPLIQRHPMLFQQRSQLQQVSLQTTAQHTSTTSDLTNTTESIWGRSPIQEKATTSSQWPNVDSVWEQSNSNSQEELIRLKQQQEQETRRMEKKKERERQKKAEEEQRKKEEAQRRIEEELRIKQQQEVEAKALRDAQEKKERERLRLIEEDRRRKEDQEAEQERERLRQEQERLAAMAATEQKRIEEAKRSQQREEEERKLKEQQQQASLEAQHRKSQQLHQHQLQLQQQQQQQQHPAWSVMGPYSNPSQVTAGASLLQIQQQEEAKAKKQQLLREQQLRAQQMAAAAAAAQMQAGWTGVGKGPVATSPTTGKSFLEIQMEQQKTAKSKPPPVQRQASAPGFGGSVWSNPGSINTSSHVPPVRQHSSSSSAPTTTTGWHVQPGTPQRLPKMNEMDDDFWDLCMKDIPVAHRPTPLPQSQTRTSASKAKKMDKHEERIRSIFATPLASDVLVEWCEQQFTTIQTELDAATFVNFLLQFESPYEVHDYIKLHMGDSPTTQEFTRQFLEKAKQCKQLKQPTSSSHSSSISQVTKPKPTPPSLQQQQAFPPPSSSMAPKQPSRQDTITKSTTSVSAAATAAGTNGGGKKKKKGKMQKVDPASILGFSVNAAERPNAGEIQSVHDAH